MKPSIKPELLFLGWFIGLPVVVLSAAIWLEWWRSGQQVAIYEQQGVHMTRWQVIIDLHPALGVERKP